MFQISKKTIFSATVGNILELYDFFLWSLFSVFLAQTFLPKHSSLSDIFLIFLITYLFRPIGGLLFGLLSDQLGRKKTLTISIILMGFCTSFVAILPSYQSIGISATIFLIFIRLFQVLSIGGEYISSVALLIESCPEDKKGFYGSWAAFGVNAGIMLASIIGALITYLINNHTVPDWSWRVAFLLSFLTSLLGFWIRISIPESYQFVMENAQKNKRSIAEIINEVFFSLKEYIIESISLCALVLFGVSATILIHVLSPIYMTTVNSLSNSTAFLFNAVGLFFVSLMIPFFGMLSDKLGRIKIISFGILFLIFYSLPYFLIITTGNQYQILFAHIIVSIPCACIYAVSPVLITEIFPVSIRCSISGFLYSIAACIGSGFTPVIALKFLDQKNIAYSLSLLILILGYFCLLNIILLHRHLKKNLGYEASVQLQPN